MTTQERLREAAEYLRRQYPRPCSNGMYVDELMIQAADEMDKWIGLLAEVSVDLTAERIANEDPAFDRG